MIAYRFNLYFAPSIWELLNLIFLKNFAIIILESEKEINMASRKNFYKVDFSIDNLSLKEQQHIFEVLLSQLNYNQPHLSWGMFIVMMIQKTRLLSLMKTRLILKIGMQMIRMKCLLHSGLAI